MKTKYVLNEADIKEAIAAYVARKHGGTIKAARVTIVAMERRDDRHNMLLGNDISATVEGDA